MNQLHLKIKEDHERLKAQLQKMIAANDGVQALNKGELDLLKSLFISHARAEEHILYDALKREQQTEDLAYESFEEHHVAENIMHELENVSDPRVLSAKLVVLKDLLENHIEQEESDLFDRTVQIFGVEQLDQMSISFEDLRDQLQSDMMGEPLARRLDRGEAPLPSLE